jgi:ParB/RepB/Spo0J family partition protein
MGRRRKPLRHLQKMDNAMLELPSSAAHITSDDLAELTESLESRGQQEPILVTEGSGAGRWRVIVGTRRVLAARRLGWPHVEAIVLPGVFQAEIRTIERLQAGHFEPFALADTLQRLKDSCDWTQTHLGHAIGKNRDFVANILAITQIDPTVRRYITDNGNGNSLTARHLRYVARTSPAEQLAMAKEIISEGLSTKNLERQKHSDALRDPHPEFIRVRTLRRIGTPEAPESAKEWRKYYRQLTTDLRRLDRQEQRESRRALDLLAVARLRRRLVKREANRKRRALARELRQARRHLDHVAGVA